MIAFGTAVTDRHTYEAVALPGIRRAGESDTAILARFDEDSIQAPYNSMLAEAREIDGLEAIVLVHQDLELLDDTLAPRLREAFASDPRVGVVGSYGCRGLPLRAWRDPERLFGTATTSFVDIRYSTGAHEVDTVDGSLLAIAPWVARTIRFDEGLARDFHGYDIDFCQRVRAAGGLVVCVDVPYRHRMARLWADEQALRRALATIAHRWDPALRPPAWAASLPPEGMS